MNAEAVREWATDAIRYWELRRLPYNVVLAAVVLIYFGLNYPKSLDVLSVDLALGLFLLAVMANVVYCAAYVVDIFAQASGFREAWRNYRWALFGIGTLFAAVITRFFVRDMFRFGVK